MKFGYFIRFSLCWSKRCFRSVQLYFW